MLTSNNRTKRSAHGCGTTCPRAAAYFGVDITGEPQFGWCLRSLSAPARSQHEICWLRVGSEQTRWLEDGYADFWTGNVDATEAVGGIPRPQVLASTEWHAPEQARRVRAEIMTLLPGHPCSPTDVLRAAVDLSDSWWAELRRSVDLLATVPTERNANRSTVSTSAREVLGIELPITAWETAHGDLHWNNLLRPELGILDWEMWGRGPAGTDAATLYCYSLLMPEVARTVWTVFADVLDAEAGRTALLEVIARLLRRCNRMGDHPDLEPPLRRLADDLLG